MGTREWRIGAGAWIVGGLVVAALVFVLTEFLPQSDADALFVRVAPVLGFVVAITIVAELAREAAVFDVVAQRLARWGRGRVLALWGLVVALATVSTVFLSLDTTAVIVTPVVIVLAQSIGVSPLPFAFATVWLANTASLALPVSNLTNLLAASAIGEGPSAFIALSWAPALAGIVVPVAILTLLHRRTVFARYPTPVPRRPADPLLFWSAAAILLVLMPLLALTREVWIPAALAALALVVLFAVRRRRVLRLALVPWRAIALAASLFVLVEAAHAQGLLDFLTAQTANGGAPGDLFRMAALGAVSANAINNLPAYLVLEPAAGDAVALMALLIGVNLGPLVTPWASLATLLWYHRITALGIRLSWSRFLLWGLVAAVLTVVAAVFALILVSG